MAASSLTGSRLAAGGTAIVASSLIIALAAMPTATATHSATQFELDGNASASTTTSGDDWSLVADASATTGILADAAATDANYFTGKGSLDTLDVTQWRYSGKAVSATDQITDAYAASYATGAVRSMYFGLDRFAASSGASVGFWLFQRPITLGANGAFTGAHANGDVFVSATFSKAGAVTAIQAYTWLNGALLGPASTGAECQAASTAGNECGIANRNPQASPWPYTPKTGAAGTFPTSAFFEGAINLTALASSGTCFSSFLAETRSSQASNAPLQDFRLGALQTCHAKIAIDPQSAPGDVATNHPLTLHVAKDLGSGYVPAVAVAVTAALVSGPGGFVGPNTCTTDGLGTCSVNITSPVPGTTVVSASASLTIGGASLPVSTDGVAPNSGPASTLWSVPVVTTATSTSPSAAVLALGGSVRDLASVEDQAGDPVPVGNVTFYVCAGPASPCLAGTPVGLPVALDAGHADSTLVTPSDRGTYCFRAEYSGGTTAAKVFLPSNDTGTTECFDVGIARSRTVSAPSSPSIILGQIVWDNATVTGLGAGFPVPTGNVTFFLDGAPIGTPVPVSATGHADSLPVPPESTGVHCFRAEYSGDSYYEPSNDSSASECFEVVAPGATNTTLTASPNPLTLPGLVHLDALVVDSHGLPVPGGVVTFGLCYGLAPCLDGFPFYSSGVNGLGHAFVNVGFGGPGVVCFSAEYSGFEGAETYAPSADKTLNGCVTVV